MEFVIRIAGKNILICSVYESIRNRCREYLIDSDAATDIEITTDEDMIVAEQKGIQRLDRPIEGLMAAETLLVHRLIAEALLDYATLLMHGAVVAVGGASYMFAGHSGTGKTTHIKKWLENAEDSFVVNGDKPFIVMQDDEVYACGSPWCGKENYGTNVIVPLRGIVFMDRSEDNQIEEAPFISIFPKLLEQTYQPADADKMRKTLELLKRLNGKVKFYRFKFNNMKDDAFRVAYEALTGNG